jgi:uncharacterized protein
MLQRFDLKLMDLEEEKGDLPGIVRNLTDQLHELQSRIDQLQREISEHISTRAQSTLDAETLNDRVESLKKQLFQVRNNKEYDAITKELNDAESGIIKKLQAAEEHESKQKELQTILDEITDKFGMLKNELTENQNELQSVSKIHEKEELSLRHERDKIARRIPEDTLQQYDRIRFAKDGKAVVPIKRGACGGCYKTVPPQLNLLLRQNDEIYICENCGRILIAEEIAAEVNKVA